MKQKTKETDYEEVEKRIELSEVLDEMCLKCFREQTDQTHYWYDMPPATKILKEGVRIRMYRDSKGKQYKLYGNFTDAHHCGEMQ